MKESDHVIVFRPKWIPGDKVWETRSKCTQKPIDCHACDGKGMVAIKDMEWNCPRCNGLGQNSKYEYQPEELTVVSLQVEMEQGDPKLYIQYGCVDKDWPDKPSRKTEKYLYGSIEEAQAECDKQNKEDI